MSPRRRAWPTRASQPQEARCRPRSSSRSALSLDRLLLRQCPRHVHQSLADGFRLLAAPHLPSLWGNDRLWAAPESCPPRLDRGATTLAPGRRLPVGPRKAAGGSRSRARPPDRLRQPDCLCQPDRLRQPDRGLDRQFGPGLDRQRDQLDRDRAAASFPGETACLSPTAIGR
jgi:hypothetical protein